MVAMTRSRNNLYLTYSGSHSTYLRNFAGDCSRINVSDVLADKQQYLVAEISLVFNYEKLFSISKKSRFYRLLQIRFFLFELGKGS